MEIFSQPTSDLVLRFEDVVLQGHCNVLGYPRGIELLKYIVPLFHIIAIAIVDNCSIFLQMLSAFSISCLFEP